jgi:hypothetical protein
MARRRTPSPRPRERLGDPRRARSSLAYRALHTLATNAGRSCAENLATACEHTGLVGRRARRTHRRWPARAPKCLLEVALPLVVVASWLPLGRAGWGAGLPRVEQHFDRCPPAPASLNLDRCRSVFRRHLKLPLIPIAQAQRRTLQRAPESKVNQPAHADSRLPGDAPLVIISYDAPGVLRHAPERLLVWNESTSVALNIRLSSLTYIGNTIEFPPVDILRPNERKDLDLGGNRIWSPRERDTDPDPTFEVEAARSLAAYAAPVPVELQAHYGATNGMRYRSVLRFSYHRISHEAKDKDAWVEFVGDTRRSI